jgi:hypothetical protein
MWLPLSKLLPLSIKKAGIEKPVSDALVCQAFDRIAKSILGEHGEHCHAVYIKDRIIWIAVLSNSISNELKLYEQDILKALADAFGKSRVTSLRFMI